MVDEFEVHKRLQQAAHILGLTSGAITVILTGPDSEMRSKLDTLWHNLSRDIGLLFSSQPAEETTKQQ